MEERKYKTASYDDHNWNRNFYFSFFFFGGTFFFFLNKILFSRSELREWVSVREREWVWNEMKWNGVTYICVYRGWFLIFLCTLCRLLNVRFHERSLSFFFLATLSLTHFIQYWVSYIHKYRLFIWEELSFNLCRLTCNCRPTTPIYAHSSMPSGIYFSHPTHNSRHLF